MYSRPVVVMYCSPVRPAWVEQVHRGRAAVALRVDHDGVQDQLQPLQHALQGHQVLVHPETDAVFRAVAVGLRDHAVALFHQLADVPVYRFIRAAYQAAIVQPGDVPVQLVAQQHEGVGQVLVLRHHAQHPAVERASGDPQADHLHGEQQLLHGERAQRQIVQAAAIQQGEQAHAIALIQCPHPFAVALFEEHVDQHMVDGAGVGLVGQQLVVDALAQFVPEIVAHHAGVHQGTVQALPCDQPMHVGRKPRSQGLIVLQQSQQPCETR